MSTKKYFAVAVGLALGFSSARAASITILNNSFEGPVTPTFNYGPINDWTISGAAGVWNPSTYGPAVLSAPDGVQVGYINGGSISQILTAALQANSTYNLGILVGGRADGYNPGTGYSVSLYAGSTLLTSVVPVTPVTSGWTLVSGTYTSGNSVAPNQLLSIVISYPGVQFDFDNVTLSEVTSVPDGGSTCALLGMGLLGIGFLRHKFQRA